MAISFIAILFLMLFFGGGAALVALLVFAVMKGRAGIALLIGGLACMGLLLVVGLLLPFWAYSRASLGEKTAMSIGDSAVETPQLTINRVPQPFPSPPSNFHTSWNISLTPVIFIGVGVVALLALAARRGFAHSAAGGHGRIWPAFLVLPLLALFLLGSVRYQSSTSSHAEQAARESQALQQQQLAIAKQVAAMSNNVQNQIAKMDIHELMDKFDAPRIALQAPSAPTAAPAALAIAAAAQAVVAPPATPAAEVASITPDVATKPGNPAGSRPAWIDEPPKRTGDVRREVIATEEYESVDECYQAADVILMLKAYEHLQQLAGRPYTNGALPSITFQSGMILADGNVLSWGHSRSDWSDVRLRQLIDMGITTDYLRRGIVGKDPNDNESREFIESVDRSFGPMKKLYVQIEFSPAVDRELQQHWDAYNRQERFAQVGVGAASVLGLLSMVWGLLKIDTATKGYYTKRLFLGVPAAIIGGFLLLLLIDMAK